MSSFVDKLEELADSYMRYLDEYSKWFYVIGSVIIYFFVVIPETISSGFHLLFVLSMIFVACIIGWPMMLVYMLPCLIIRIFCYCIKNPLDAFLTLTKLVLSFVALFLLVLWLRAALYGGYEE